MRSASARVLPVADPQILHEREPQDVTWETVAMNHKRARLGRHLSEALAALTPRERRLVLRKIIEDATWAEIADLEGSSLDTVRNAAWRSRAALRMRLDQARRERPLLGLLPMSFTKLKDALVRIRQRASDSMSSSFSSLASTLVEQVGAVFVGLVVLSLSWAGPPAFSMPHVMQEQPLNNKLVATELPRAAIPSATGDEASDRTSPNQSLVEYSLATTPAAPKSLAPSGGKLIVEFTVPALETPVYRGEFRYECGQQGAALLPDSGPIRAAC